jgi:hypothetical protein
MGGLIALLLFLASLAIALYYLFRKLVFRKEIPSDVSSDDLIGGALNLTVLLGSILFFVYLLRPIFLDGAWLHRASAPFRRALLMGSSLGLSYVVLLLVNRVFTGGKRT